jgi:Tfp pilus assembly protein PilO
VLDELKFRYKEVTLAKRLLLCALLAAIPSILIYFSSAGDVDAAFEAATQAEELAAQKLQKADHDVKNLPALESELESTREQLKAAEARLPDQVQIDEVLRNVGKTVKSSAANVILFQPESEIIRGEVYKYVEVPVRITVEAHEYSQICEWLDSVAGENQKMFLKSWNITRGKAYISSKDSEATKESGDQTNLAQKSDTAGRQARANLRLTFEGEFSLYKLASTAAQAAEGSDSNPGKGAKTPGGQTTPEGQAVKDSPAGAVPANSGNNGENGSSHSNSIQLRSFILNRGLT